MYGIKSSNPSKLKLVAFLKGEGIVAARVPADSLTAAGYMYRQFDADGRPQYDRGFVVREEFVAWPSVAVRDRVAELLNVSFEGELAEVVADDAAADDAAAGLSSVEILSGIAEGVVDGEPVTVVVDSVESVVAVVDSSDAVVDVVVEVVPEGVVVDAVVAEVVAGVEPDGIPVVQPVAVEAEVEKPVAKKPVAKKVVGKK